MNPTNVTTAPLALGQAFTLHSRFALLLACVLAALWLSVAWLNHKNEPRSGSYAATMIRSDGSHGGSGRVIFATT
jgi:hypothetical protein